MKTNFPLLAKITAPRNLNEAWLRIHAKKSAGGLDGMTVGDFAADLEKNLDILRQDLLEQRYVPEPLAVVRIPKKPGARETRELGLPGVRDKVAQEAVRRIIAPLLERDFLDCSYGYRSGKGPQRAVGRVKHYLVHRKAAWVVSADIDDFFGTLRHDLLLERLSCVLEDEAVVRLLELWLKMGRVDGVGRWHDVYSGVSQGGVISPLLANFYLHPLDAYLAPKYAYVRYSDDFVILCSNRREATRAHGDAVGFLEANLGLRLNRDTSPVRPVDDGFTFLGIGFRNGSLAIADEKLDKIRAKLHQVTRLSPGRSFGGIIRRVNESAAGWKRYYGRLVEPAEYRRIEDIVIDQLAGLTARALRKGLFTKNAEIERELEVLALPGRSDPKARRRLVKDIIARARRRESSGQGKKKHGARPAETVVRGRKRKELRQRAGSTDLDISAPGSFLGKTGQRIVVRRQRRVVCEVPAHGLRSITIGGRGVSLSAEVVRFCAGRNIPLLFTAAAGRVEAMLTAPENGAADIQLGQLRAHLDGERRFRIARRIAVGKMKNQRNLAKYLGKYHCRKNSGFRQRLNVFMEQWDTLHREVRALEPGEGFRNRIMAVEGRCAAHYWDLVRALLQGRVEFPGRKRQGATDLANSLLNYGYAILQSRVYQAILRSGLQPQVSFLHEPHRSKPTLSFDLMEEFRSQVVDRPVISLLNRAVDVGLDRQGRLSPDTRKILITRVFERLAAICRFRGREMTLDEIIAAQARHFARTLRDGGRYRPYVGKW